MAELRDYQNRAISMLYEYFRAEKGHPCLVLPTGSGKSWIIAELCRDAITNWPETRILMLTHVKELIEQDLDKLLTLWPDAPVGVYSASIGQKELSQPITFAGIQSIRNRAEQIGHVDLIVVDECFVAGTKISTPTGDKDINLVRCGDIVYNQCGFGKVESVSCRPSFDIYRLELDNGQTIECTGNHKFFTEQGWKRARELEICSGGMENRTSFFSIEDMFGMWKRVHTLDKKTRQRKYKKRSTRESVEETAILLSEVCKEISSNNSGFSGKEKDKQYSKGNETQTYKSWRERAITTFASACFASCARGWVDSGISNKNESRTPEWEISELLQGGYCESCNDDSYRNKWTKPFNNSEERARHKEKRTFGSVRLVGISHLKRESPAFVYNIQVSGHPSYFANGIAVHNCHLISHRDEGGYRKLISELEKINPSLRVIGLTATPYRLGHGMITDKPAIFDALIEPVTLEYLIYNGYLAPLKSKLTDARLSTSGVHKRGGEYIESELQAAVDKKDMNASVVQEVISLAGDRKAWLFFCSGVQHAYHIRDALLAAGITAETVTGETSKKERERIIEEFKAGRIKALTNANVLTTGFDYPDIDLIAMLRPTLSPGLYVQMAGRGLRPKSHTDHCLVLDFAGVVNTHGPITAVRPPDKKGEGNGEAPVKVCEKCQEIVHLSTRVCPSCGEPFPEPESKKLKLCDVDIMGLGGIEMNVDRWFWAKHTSQASGKDLIKVAYRSGLAGHRVIEYFCINHGGYAGQKAVESLAVISKKAGVDLTETPDIETACELLNGGRPPDRIKYRSEGKFYRINARYWDDETGI